MKASLRLEKCRACGAEDCRSFGADLKQSYGKSGASRRRFSGRRPAFLRAKRGSEYYGL